MVIIDFVPFKKETLSHLNKSLHVFDHLSRKTKRKAVSEIIATTILLAITVVGAVMISVMLQNTLGSAGSGFNSASLEAQLPPAIKMTGYDTRDGSSLFGISGFNNYPNSELCTDSCAGINDATPASGGTEFIVIRIKNEGTDPYSVKNILINDMEHLWDNTTTGPLCLSSCTPSPVFPGDGKFSIMLASDVTKTLRNTNAISSGEEVLLIIKLNDKLVMSGTNPDVSLNTPLIVEFTGSLNAPTFVILSGDTM